MIETGDKAPDFTLQDQDSEQVSLGDYTPGCTTQACGTLLAALGTTA